MKNSYKFLFVMSLMIGTLITISSSSWFTMWMGLEINLLSFIPLMMSSKNLFSSEASLKYFLIQALASTTFLFSILLFSMFLNFKWDMPFYLYMTICFSMMMKSGMAPFHFWFPSVMEGLNWNSNLILMTWQKIAPLMILSYSMSLNLLILIILFSMFFGSLGGLNQTSLRKLMAFSSINHMGWMMAGMLYNELLWLTYLFFYIILNINTVFMFNNFKLFNINQTFKMLNSNFFMKMMIFITLLSLGGLPPFLGFFPKWMIIEMMILIKMFFILTFMLFLTLITLYFYMRISYSALLVNFIEMKWNYKNNLLLKNSKILSGLSFFTLFGLLLINLIYFLF